VKDIAKLQAGSWVNTRRGKGLETEFTAGARRRYERGHSGRSSARHTRGCLGWDQRCSPSICRRLAALREMDFQNPRPSV